MIPDHVNCDRCDSLDGGRICDRCWYLITNMKRWRRVAEHLHAETCKHPDRQKPTSCSKILEDIYNDMLKKDLERDVN